MKDPYSILGVTKNATDEEIKNAYREMARKYHPDNYTDNPLADLAGERMKEINEAYDQIMNSRRHRHSNGGSTYADPNASSNFADVRNQIAAGRLEEAQELLDGVPPEHRDAEWYFLNGTVLYKRGWFDAAYTSMANACRMNPTNPEYRAAFNQLQRQRNGNFAYHGTNGGYNAGGCSGCDVCQGLICADCCCECMGGDLIRCC